MDSDSQKKAWPYTRLYWKQFWDCSLCFMKWNDCLLHEKFSFEKVHKIGQKEMHSTTFSFNFCWFRWKAFSLSYDCCINLIACKPCMYSLYIWKQHQSLGKVFCLVFLMCIWCVGKCLRELICFKSQKAGQWFENAEKGKASKAAGAVSDFPVHPFQWYYWVPGTHHEFCYPLEFLSGCFLSLPLRTLLTICGLGRIWKLLPVSKINSLKSRAWEDTNHVSHQASLIPDVLQLLPFEVPFPVLYFNIILFSKCPRFGLPPPGHVSCNSLGLAMAPLEPVLFGWGWSRALLENLSQILKIRSQWRCFPKQPSSAGKCCCFLPESWVKKRRKREGEEKTQPTSHLTERDSVPQLYSNWIREWLRQAPSPQPPPFDVTTQTFQQCWI